MADILSVRHRARLPTQRPVVSYSVQFVRTPWSISGADVISIYTRSKQDLPEAEKAKGPTVVCAARNRKQMA